MSNMEINSDTNTIITQSNQISTAAKNNINPNNFANNKACESINYRRDSMSHTSDDKKNEELKDTNNSNKEESSDLDESQKLNIIIRFGIVCIGISIWLLYRNFLQLSDNKWDFIYCFEDRLLTKIFLNITNYISQNLYIRDFLLIASSGFLDIFMLCFMYVFVTNGYSWNPLIHMATFYLFRGFVVQSLVIMQIYDTYVFEYPGFPSLVVPYFRAADFFYSGHTGCALLLGMHMADMGYEEMRYVGLILSLFEGLVLTLLRIHYSIDIIFGLICSHYLYYIAKIISKYADDIFPMGTLAQKSGEIEIQGQENVNDETSNNQKIKAGANYEKVKHQYQVNEEMSRNQMDEIIDNNNSNKRQ